MTAQSSTWIIIAIVIVCIIIIAAVALRRRRSQELRDRFGPEYDRHVRTIGSQSKAEADLAAREQRHRELNIRPLTPGARDRYLEDWRSVQSRFVDEPEKAIADADRLVELVMRDRGYPIGDFQRQAEDLSVEHASVLSNYRVAHSVYMESQERGVSTEDMRRAVVAYRTLFESLLEVPSTKGSV